MAMRKIATLLKGVALLLFFFASPTFGQSQTVSGTIIADDDGSPLLGVTVTNKSTNKKTTTNTAGFYSIAAEKGQVLAFSYVGYSTKEITVGDAKSYSIKLVLSDKDVNEVVVTAYGIKKNKRDLPYQAIVVSGDDVANTKRENFINSLAGRIPGATITSTTGLPGSSTSIVLRGPTSIDGNNQPLFVVDGLMIDNGAFEMQDRLPAQSSASQNLANRTADFANRATDINPDDIESITVLKGPEATTMYGSDGANGAILITTKKGKKGRSSISYSSTMRFEKVYRFPQIQNVYNQGSGGYTNENLRTFFGAKYPSTNTFFNNIDNFFRTGKSQQHNIAIEGGNDVSTYRFTGTYNDQEGIIPNSSFKRYIFGVTNTYKLSTKLNITSRITYTNSNTTSASKGSGGFLLSLLTWPSDDDIRIYTNPDGSRRSARQDGSLVEDDNPLFDVNKNKNYNQNDRLNGNVQLSFDANKWLNLTAIMGVDYYGTLGTLYYHPESNIGRTSGGLIQQYRENQKLVNGAYRATIRKKTGNLNNTIIASFTFDTRKYQVNAVKGERVFDPNLISINNVDPITYSSLTTPENNNRTGTFINYTGNYKNWLTLSLAGRMDGSSRLVNPYDYESASPFYFYWSGGSTFIFSDVLKVPAWLSYGKLRINYATTGRDPRSAYVKANNFQPAQTTGGGFVPFVTQGSPLLKPEFSQQFETGFELKFLKGKIGLDVAYYDNRTKDQLMSTRISYAAGAILKWINGGVVSNRGIEILLNTTPIKNKNFTWDATLNFAKNVNKVIDMPNGYTFFYNSDTWVSNIRGTVVKGGSTYALAGASFARNTRGDLLISPTSGLPVVTTDYSVVAGDRMEDFRMGFQSSFTYKNLNLSFNLDIRKGGDIWNGTEYFMYTRGQSIRTLDRETPRIVKGVLNDGLQNTSNPTPNTIVVTPLYRSDFYSTAPDVDFIEKDINWIRLRDIRLAYKLPATFIKRQNVIKSASIFITGTDLFLLTNYRGADPAVNANNASTRAGVGGVGMDFGNVATPRGLLIGAAIQF